MYEVTSGGDAFTEIDVMLLRALLIEEGWMPRKMRTADEYDAYTAWRKVLVWTSRAGAIKKVKRRTHKRERREGRTEARNWE